MNELPLGITLLMNRRPFLLLLAHVLFAITDGGIATCLKAATGEIVWQERVGGNFSASPVAAEGWICFVGDGGETTIIAAGPVFWRHFEQRVLDLQRLGIEADLILWHPTTAGVLPG